MKEQDKILNEVYKKISKNKTITYDELDELLPDDLQSAEEIEDIVTSLSLKGIKVLASREPAKILKKKIPKPTLFKVEDPTKSYFRELGKFTLLNRDEEIEFSKTMETGYRSITQYIFEPVHFAEKLVEECATVEDGTRSLDQIARVEFECLLNKKALWRDRQKFIRRVKAIKRSVEILKNLLNRKMTPAVQRKIKLLRHISLKKSKLYPCSIICSTTSFSNLKLLPKMRLKPSTK